MLESDVWTCTLKWKDIMSEPRSTQPSRLDQLLARVRAGESAAVNEVVEYFAERLRRLARQRRRASSTVARWEGTDDIAQAVAIRLSRVLLEVQPESESHLVNLAATMIRREIIDLTRKHSGKGGFAGNHASTPPGKDLNDRLDGQSPTPGPETTSRIREIHGLVERLPVEERVVFERHVYLDQEHAEIAEELGVSVATVKRRFRHARLLLAEWLGESDRSRE